GIEVNVGHMESEARELNRFFIHFISTGRPYIILKAAITLDGFIADSAGNSKWISSSRSRSEVHLLRSRVDAVLVGAGTVRADNPELTVRMVAGRDPRKIILNKSGTLSPEFNAFTDKTILVTAPGAMSEEKKTTFVNIGVHLLENSEPELAPLLKSFATMGLASLLVEGGAGVFGAFVEQGLVDEFIIYVAPVILGQGIRLFHMSERTMSKAIRISGRDTTICLREL
ncbi:MAG: bifunctional diaminohydroxyphosphoribosylaminopyrimidine deaminase/5-amino-6-(5-phosphoribosylamino)uracil reductase RibD, partial [Holophagae bacterium]|nr:bifunctional diaminohydroxyphosphoribosylaminopyrimidine deaminase/5-amino-6-(5-phosphoribosylamino)uracil reductase RibD [Holophagae bacterium]